MTSLRRRLLGGADTAEELRLVRRELRALRKEVHRIAETQDATRRRQRGLVRRQKVQKSAMRGQRDEIARIIAILRVIYDEEPAARRKLLELRATPEYELAFTEADPLVSVVIPTFDRPRLLVERSIPSVLAQTYENLEVVIVGDGASAAVGEAVASLADERISYSNRSHRGPYPSDPHLLRKVAGGPPFNEGLRRARGRWIAPLADDDAFRPNHVETLLRAAQRGRYEVCAGRLLIHRADGTATERGDESQVLSQAAISHSGLRFIEAEPGDELFREAWDKSMWRRVERAGARVGFVDEVVSDYYGSMEFAGDAPPGTEGRGT